MSHALALQPSIWDSTSLPNGKSVKVISRNIAMPTFTETVPYYGRIHQERQLVEIKERDEFIRRISSLSQWKKNWDDRGSEKPKISSIRNAKKWGAHIYSSIVNTNYEWRHPFISADEGGDVVFEWWYHDRKLTLDISGGAVAFTEIRDADGDPRITMGDLTRNDLPAKLRWLILGE